MSTKKKPATAKGSPKIGVAKLPAETTALRRGLTKFLANNWTDPATGVTMKIGSFRWGIYAFYDYDGEPIYVGQTKEKVSSRIRRHLTNQRTDAVAMSVLDPFEVAAIEVWALPEYQSVVGKRHPKIKDANNHLNALEYAVYERAKAQSRFKAVLNERDPPVPVTTASIPDSLRAEIVDKDLKELRGHPDVRIARRASTIARLTQVIAERQVQGGLRRTLVTQAKRLAYLAQIRYEAMGGEASVEIEDDEDRDESGDTEEN